MGRAGTRGCLAWLSALLTALALTSCSPASSSAAAPAASPALVSASSTAATSLSSGPSRSQRIKVLTSALKVMQRNRGKLRHQSPGLQDVLDYQVAALWKRGIDGTGTTIAVIEGWNSPMLASFIANRDKLLGLPNPQIKTIYPTGKHRLPATCPPGMASLPGYGSCQSWEAEAALDAFSVHMLAPYAKILVVVAPADSEITDDAASNVAPPEFMQAVEYVSENHLANVISISDGTAESSYSHGFEEIRAQDAGELTAAANGIPVVLGTGDCGAAQHLAVAGGCSPSTMTTTRATAAWDDSPWVTAVGGSIPNMSASGKRRGPDRVWNDWRSRGGYGEGAGFSTVYARPGYQDSVAAITRSKWRSVPDITMDASGGTSESGPLFAAILALATQVNRGHDVGPINSVLYRVLGPAGLKDGIADVVSGNNTVTWHGKVYVRGFTARKGFDVASGWGTIRASTFVPALVTATAAGHQDAAIRAQAAAALLKLEHQEQLSPSAVSPGDTTMLTAQGFLPGHPVRLDIDGRTIATLHADDQGSVSYLIKPSALGLKPGRHVVKLVSMLITTTNGFSSS
jgi:subtilase family serine protease